MNGKHHHQDRRQGGNAGGGNRPQGQHDRGPKPRNEAEVWLEQNVAEILDFQQSGKLKELLANIKAFTEQRCGSITTSQLRNVFAKVKPCKTWHELQLIRPQLAYVAARQNRPDAREVVDFLESIIARVEQGKDEQIRNFISFFEAIVAYHKFFHGNKKSS